MEEKDACAQFLTSTHLEQLVKSLFSWVDQSFCQIGNAAFVTTLSKV